MSNAKNPKKDPAKEKTKQQEKVKSELSGGNSASEISSSDKTKEKPIDKLTETSKSASQLSISHFSSVSSKEYRSGWTNIFGNKKRNRSSKNK